ncbi:OmpA family protein [Bradyrhizobium sp.]|uniref:OmpA family protein n=1 Tax=Bradyrhizobium sp. TaxID=376 RepID=UPI0007C98482|nr:OmpA family protein [Bradyrhizobium sp.]
MRVKGYGRSINIVFTSVFAGAVVCAATSVGAAVNVRDLMQSQKARDQAFRTLRAAATEYTFDYVVIQIPPGSLPGVDVSVPVSHIRFKSTIFFAFNKSDIEPAAEQAVVDLARTVIADKSAKSLLIVGHTDSIGPDDYNSALSLSRAVAVATRLKETGVSERLVGLVPMGEAQPAATNKTKEGQAKNRRVEFFISDVPGATRKAIERIKFDPCHRNDQDVPAGQTNPECTRADVRIPLYEGASGRSASDYIDLGRTALSMGAIPTSRPPLPTEILVRPSLKELMQE